MKIFNQRLTSNILSQYSTSHPSPENAVDIFRGEWASRLPEIQGIHVPAGNIGLFDDERIHLANKCFGFKDKNVLELGPLEGGHSYMLERMGAASVLAIEANTRGYMKCLIVKELYELSRCRFILGDFVKYLRQCGDRFDCCIASGVLYHMQNPPELLQLIAKVSDQAFIWTHYYDDASLKASKRSFGMKRFGDEEHAEFDGFAYSRVKQRYGLGLTRLAFCGGTASYSYWMRQDGIIKALKHFGFRTVEVSFNTPEHPNGPAFCLTCSKS